MLYVELHGEEESLKDEAGKKLRKALDNAKARWK